MKRVFQAFLGKGLWVFGLVVLLWLATGTTFVGPEEQGVMLRFGKVSDVVSSGPNWNWPRPIGQTFKPKVMRNRKIEVGFRTVRVGPPAEYEPVPREAWMLTGDQNIVELEFIVQYKIRDAEKFLFNLRDPAGTLKDAAEASMREIIGRAEIDSALTEGKGEIQIEAQALLQKFMDQYESGIQIETVKLQEVNPPGPVNDAFKDVVNARQDKERLINEAKGFENDVIPAARGQAAQAVNEAQGYRQARITEAEGEAHRFVALLSEYQKAKGVTRKRLYLETMEEVLGKMDKTILEGKASANTLPYLPLKGTKKGGQK